VSLTGHASCRAIARPETRLCGIANSAPNSPEISKSLTHTGKSRFSQGFVSSLLNTNLDGHLLRDIGVTYAEAEQETNKPFWRG